MTNVGEAVSAMGLRIPTEAEQAAREREQLEAAFAYLQSRWPDVRLEDIPARDAYDFLRTRDKELACARCIEAGEHQCQRRHAETVCREEFAGRVSYTIRVRPCPLDTERESSQSQFERLFKYSRLTERQRSQTFEVFNPEIVSCVEPSKISRDVRRAYLLAMNAVEDGSWLTLGGKRGVGKSHLAAAIALLVMRKKGQQAYFRPVSEMLDDLRGGYASGDHDAQMSFLKEVPCLVLDDLGKERRTESNAADDFLHQIIDTRYREGRQVVITTNAASKEELASWGNASFLAPLISRMDEMGDWCFIADAEDYRPNVGNERRVRAARAQQSKKEAA